MTYAREGGRRTRAGKASRPRSSTSAPSARWTCRHGHRVRCKKTDRLRHRRRGLSAESRSAPKSPPASCSRPSTISMRRCLDDRRQGRADALRRQPREAGAAERWRSRRGGESRHLSLQAGGGRSMPINIPMPALSPTMEEGNLAKWLRQGRRQRRAGRRDRRDRDRQGDDGSRSRRRGHRRQDRRAGRHRGRQGERADRRAARARARTRAPLPRRRGAGREAAPRPRSRSEG